MLGFQIMRIVMTVFGSLFTLVGFSLLIFLWIVPDRFAGPFGDVPLPFRFFASLIALAFIAFSILWIFLLWRFSSGFAEAHRKHVERLQNAAEPVIKRSQPISCPNCGGKFLMEHHVAGAPPNCSFCGSQIRS